MRNAVRTDRPFDDPPMPLCTVSRLILPVVLVLSPCCIAPAQTPSPKASACAAAEYRQFDFWVGDWEVRNPAGKVVGHNRIENAHGGCALIEHWASVNGVTGTSVNLYDRDRGRWHQTWVDSSGGLLELDGGIEGGAMVLTGEAIDAEAPSKVARQKITWTLQPDGQVRQLWESSIDGGKTWTTAFDGRYAKPR